MLVILKDEDCSLLSYHIGRSLRVTIIKLRENGYICVNKVAHNQYHLIL
jgi:hypothetical protein